ncbi:MULTISPECIES: 3-phosphoshikimate 1-carboxyvinyltransferase [Brenneria]|uniref:3-phosphoshikimate 1-carboxyvinyltransferase n=1 Tax=Brenneria nigrifluens DSM 30175 = ATCC 13028 TaxID=1121120 RepID=A0A2U1UFF4_9GAMM|nr:MULTISPECIES: 3-phosphoshikimate 1-carboxyvinyltransferase [Brenneria]EHD22172.1 3-phosphoshikimate 1-carboxyvinyltransferase [Brenneria sp. EniD312]PWC20342.1 3-phosphoshikimate 1-carboxyvinyltransferase [Brenneria nigrifluens DSM 30175 = ATCC 13028]QCR05201.1 3-phosphoshikimate 1-carboxyvinyltransferase [Brenneria nigrifluens DSM 30175 = ATCC 13028]
MLIYPDRNISPAMLPEHPDWSAAARYVPSDKSISHRALLFAALSEHPVTIVGINQGAAVTLLIDALQHLGLKIDFDRRSGAVAFQTSLRTADCHGMLNKKERRVYLGPSSAAARLLLGVLCGLGVGCVVDGDQTLRNRPFDWIVEPLTTLGGQFEYLGRAGCLPLRLLPSQITSGRVSISIGSAQSISAVLFAAIAARVPVEIAYSVEARDHTQLMAQGFGDEVEDIEHVLTYRPRQFRPPGAITIPLDPSALAYPAALFWLLNRDRPEASVWFEGVCINPTRIGFFYWMQRCGFGLEISPDGRPHGEKTGTIALRGGGAFKAQGMQGKESLHSMIDEIPLMVAIAALLPGEAAFDDLYELTFKESDRITATCRMLRTLGIDAVIDGYSIHTEGGQRPSVQSDVTVFNDHRLSMTAHVLMLAHGLAGRILGGECYKTSFPDFDQCLRAIFRG